MILYFNNREWASFFSFSFFLPSFSFSPSRTFSHSVRAYGLVLANRRIEERILEEVVRTSMSFLLHSTFFLRSLGLRARAFQKQTASKNVKEKQTAKTSLSLSPIAHLHTCADLSCVTEVNVLITALFP